jgi:nucleoside-diphosphate-sugar epimerase
MLLLTGGTGLIGRHTLTTLRQRGHEVVALARSAESAGQLRGAGAQVLEGDVSDPATWERIERVEAIIHSAASVFTRSTWADYLRVNVDATRLAARRARTLGVPLIHISSVAVYGPHGARPVGENAAIGSLETGEFYPRSKRLAEQAVWEEVARGLRTIVLRPCVVYGEGDRLFLPKLVGIAQRGWFPVIGGGKHLIPIVYAGNVAEGVVAALESESGWGKAFNLTNDDQLTADQLVAGIAAGLGRRVRSARLPSGIARLAAGAIDLFRPLMNGHLPPVRGGVAFLSGGHPYTSAAALTDLGWRPTHRHAEALPRSVRWVIRGERA